MGTPKKVKFNQEVKALTVGEKIRLLEIGKQAGLSLSPERLPELIETALEEARLLLLPMVQWFYKPLPLDNPPSRRFERMRVMRLYSEGVVSIWLEHSGSWVVRFHEKGGGYLEADSRILSVILLGNSENFLSMRRVTEAMLEELPLLKDITLYNALVLRVLPQLLKKAQEAIEEREKSYRAMKERLSALAEFIQSLDPLVSRGKAVKMKYYSIWHEHARGVRADTDCYLCQEALKPFWEENNGRRQNDSAYKEAAGEYDFDSVGSFLQRMVWILDDIQKRRDRIKNPDAWNGGRLPFSEGELKVIEEAVRSIAAK